MIRLEARVVVMDSPTIQKLLDDEVSSISESDDNSTADMTYKPPDNEEVEIVTTVHGQHTD